MTEPTLDEPRWGIWAITIPLLVVGLAGCAYQPSGAVSPSAPGFWLGLWHGFIAPISLVGSFFADHRIYAFPNSRVLYDLGFLLGLSAWGGGGTYFARG
jgi:hypothetical protein